MKKCVIANWGHADQGKSDTIKRLVKIILEKYPSAITEPSPVGFNGDIKVIITINNLKIGIESQGDPNSRLFESLKEFSKINCDIIICATRTSGGTVDAVCKLRDFNNYDIIWVTNYRSIEKNQGDLNQLSAQHLFELIERMK